MEIQALEDVDAVAPVQASLLVNMETPGLVDEAEATPALGWLHASTVILALEDVVVVAPDQALLPASTVTLALVDVGAPGPLKFGE